MAANGEVTALVATAPARLDLSVKFTPEQRKIILDTCCGGATESEARALIAIAEARGLNPLLGECFFVKRYDSQARRDKWAVQASIDSLRIKAEQTGLYAGQDEPEYEYDKGQRIVLARVRVYRKDWPRPAVGIARWSEYVQTTREGAPTRFWQQMPHNQLAKCAEALALRKAFPAVLAKLYTPEEMAQASNDVEQGQVSEPEPEPTRAPVAELPSSPSVASAAPTPAADPDAIYRALEKRIDEARKASSMEQLKAIAGDIGRAQLDRERRMALLDIYDFAADAIEGR